MMDQEQCRTHTRTTPNQSSQARRPIHRRKDRRNMVPRGCCYLQQTEVGPACQPSFGISVEVRFLGEVPKPLPSFASMFAAIGRSSRGGLQASKIGESRAEVQFGYLLLAGRKVQSKSPKMYGEFCI